MRNVISSSYFKKSTISLQHTSKNTVPSDCSSGAKVMYSQDMQLHFKAFTPLLVVSFTFLHKLLYAFQF
jgi:hypothetical protein